MTIRYLTGRKRHRVENEKLILQIEEESYTPRSPYEYQSDTKREWRDAKVEDVTLQDAGQKPEPEQRMADLCPTG